MLAFLKYRGAVYSKKRNSVNKKQPLATEIDYTLLMPKFHLFASGVNNTNNSATKRFGAGGTCFLYIKQGDARESTEIWWIGETKGRGINQ